MRAFTAGDGFARFLFRWLVWALVRSLFLFADWLVRAAARRPGMAVAVFLIMVVAALL